MKKVLVWFILPGFLIAGIPRQKWLPPTVQLSPEQAGKGATIMGHALRKAGVHEGNKIRVKFFNHGPIGGPDRVDPWPRLEWPANSGHEYLYEMGPLFGARVKAYNPATGDSVWISIVDDPIQDGGDEDFEPIPGYVNPAQPSIAFSNYPETWPEVWADFVGQLGDTIQGLSGRWAGQFSYWDLEGDSVVAKIIADQESYYAMVDSANEEFIPGNTYGNPEYDPGNGLRGLGIKVEVRGYQWAAQPVEDVIIWVYKVTNISNKDIDSMVVGYFGDFRIGGPGSDFSDDMFGFDTTNNMVFNYDENGLGIGADGRPYPCGWLGFMFLESPEASITDGIDNDGDGLIDESQYNGIDDDGDWDPQTDDTGRDGIPGTGDFGEGNGVPDLGEPNFETLDPDEKEELGLTAVRSFPYGTAGIFAGNDSVMLEIMRPGDYTIDPGPGDIVSVFSSGFFPLPKGASQQFSIAVIMGEDSADLYQNAMRAKQIYRLNYQFPRPPEPPHLVALPGNGYVTLYWDDFSEHFPGFEGYMIFRSEDRGATWGDPITDGFGRLVWWTPIAQFDLADGITGFHPIDVNGVHFYLGDDTGLQHSFTDSSVINGKHYWYAIAAYNLGDTTLDLPPLLSSIYPVDNNPAVVEVVPTEPPAGVIPSELRFDSLSSNWVTTGNITASIALPSEVVSDSYRITFEITSTRTPPETTFSLVRLSDGAILIDHSNKIHGEDANPITDGFRVILNNTDAGYDTVVWWGASNLGIRNLSINAPVEGYFEIDFDSTIVGYGSYGGSPDTIGFRFAVFYVQGRHRTPVYFRLTEADGDTMISDPNGNDVLWIFQEGMSLPWVVAIFAHDDTTEPYIAPQPGDIMNILFHVPFTTLDTLVIRTTAQQSVEDSIREQLKKVAVVPNPYVVAAKWEIKDPSVQFGRGARELHFIHLPEEAIIRIYTVNGELVRTLRHFPGEPGYISPSTHAWNLLNKNSQEIAYGLYIFHVEGYYNGKPVGEAIGKFAVIK